MAYLHMNIAILHMSTRQPLALLLFHHSIVHHLNQGIRDQILVREDTILMENQTLDVGGGRQARRLDILRREGLPRPSIIRDSFRAGPLRFDCLSFTCTCSILDFDGLIISHH